MGRLAKPPRPAAPASSAACKKRRKKKASPRRMAASASVREPVVLPQMPSPTSSSASTPSSSSSGKECEQCGNNMTLVESSLAVGATGAKGATGAAWTAAHKKLVTTGCQVCDFVAYRKSQRPCVQCERAHCEHFCEWCGHGYHTKCARLCDEKVNALNGFCCKNCEVEHADDDEDSDGDERPDNSNSVTAKCGSCRTPFSAGNGEDDDSGFHVNESVLVENEEVLYNAVISDVDTKNERVKIHFIRWSKSFDNWYAMDDERINESLACDCCNQWFHIGCLPPIKSSGRFKDTTYVCPACIDDARIYHSGGTRPKNKTVTALANSSKSSSSRKNSMSEEPKKTKSSSRPSSNAADSDRDDVGGIKRKRKRSLSIDSTSSVAKKAAAPAAPISNKRSKSPDPPATEESAKSPKTTAHSSPQRSEASASAVASESETQRNATKAVASDKKPSASVVSMEKAAQPRRKPANSVSALLNSPEIGSGSDRERERPTYKPSASSSMQRNVATLTMLDSSPARSKSRVAMSSTSSSNVFVKLEHDRPSLPSLPRLALAANPIKNSGWATAPSSSSRSLPPPMKTGGRGPLSAFDILREVATQSIGGDFVEPASNSKPSRATASKKENKRVKSDPAPAASGPGGPSSSPSKERIHLNSFVDLHFNIRKEMYLKFCFLEDDGVLDPETAQLLRSLIYPTSDKFQDLKFVYLVNKDLPSVQLTRRLLEVVSTRSSANASSRASSPAPPVASAEPEEPQASAAGATPSDVVVSKPASAVVSVPVTTPPSLALAGSVTEPLTTGS